MSEKSSTGELFGIPYNFEQPTLRRLLSSYWQPNEGMLVKKQFGIGYTLNLANWRSWIVIVAAAALLLQERRGETDEEANEADEPVEVVVD
ncbi:hypothetical protein BRC62_01940 [Halobacteriales archaeon QH_10_67_13]|nr:MAG: hypothetical protein BRC62_01940 [Halobacteriales archaeon QH_10_67_13]